MVENGFKCLKESGSIFILTLYIDDVPLLGKELLVLRRIKQKTAYEIMPSLVGSEMCIRDSFRAMERRRCTGSG